MLRLAMKAMNQQELVRRPDDRLDGLSRECVSRVKHGHMRFAYAGPTELAQGCAGHHRSKLFIREMNIRNGWPAPQDERTATETSDLIEGDRERLTCTALSDPTRLGDDGFVQASILAKRPK